MGQKKETLKLVIVGHVDHGKSSLIGRLLYDTDSLPKDKKAELEAISSKRGMDIEWSFLLDSFQAERDQAITIDTTQIWFRSEKRNYVIIDAPGHVEFIKNMMTGAAQADTAILVIDAKEGIQEQTKRHAYLLSILGFSNVIVVVNKMDLVAYSQNVYDDLSVQIENYFEKLKIKADTIIPISSKTGEGIASLSKNLSWYEGDCLLDVLDHLPNKISTQQGQPLRMPIQDVYRHGDERIFVGRVESGVLKLGDRLSFSPGDETAVVQDIVEWPEKQEKTTEIRAGQSFAITLDRKIFVERGFVASHDNDMPMLSNVFKLKMLWLHKKPLKNGDVYTFKIGTSKFNAHVQEIIKVTDTDTLKEIKTEQVLQNQIAEIVVRSRSMLALDPYNHGNAISRCVICEKEIIRGGGLISMEGYPDQRHSVIKVPENIYKVTHLLDSNVRYQRNGHKGGIFWFTGLSGSGKSTLAMISEKLLFEKGFLTYVLDGDNVRHGLNKDLGFSPEDRAENIRRIAEVANLQADAGLITITSFISPYRADRRRAREIAPDRFHEIYIKADVATCEERDPKGLYKKARAGEIKDFTGISAPYEAPQDPELIVDTQTHSIEECADVIVEYVRKAISLDETHLSAVEQKI